MYFKTEGIILKRRNFGEADRILTMFTKDFGKVVALAKGVRRPRSKKAGHLELGTWCKVFIAKGKSLDLLTEVETIKSFDITKLDHAKSSKICHLLELVESLTPEHQKNYQVFALLKEYLQKTQNEEDFNLVSGVFKIKLLSSLGFFSATSLKSSKTKDVFEVLENESFAIVKERVKLSKESYLRLLTFLDNMIENVGQTKLKTSRFVSFDI